jgi:PiT family inorganic phosphate transporter
MLESFWFLIWMVILSGTFAFVNGWTDACNAIATVAFTRFLSPKVAVLLAVFFT